MEWSAAGRWQASVLSHAQLIPSEALFFESLRHLNARLCFHRKPCACLISEVHPYDLQETKERDLRIWVLEYWDRLLNLPAEIFTELQYLGLYSSETSGPTEMMKFRVCARSFFATIRPSVAVQI